MYNEESQLPEHSYFGALPHSAFAFAWLIQMGEILLDCNLLTHLTWHWWDNPAATGKPLIVGGELYFMFGVVYYFISIAFLLMALPTKYDGIEHFVVWCLREDGKLALLELAERWRPSFKGSDWFTTSYFILWPLLSSASIGNVMERKDPIYQRWNITLRGWELCGDCCCEMCQCIFREQSEILCGINAAIGNQHCTNKGLFTSRAQYVTSWGW